MMVSKIDLIEKYLMNEMSVREQVEFEESLRNDPDLMKEFLLRRNINEAIIEDDVINLRNTLGVILNHKSSQTKTTRKLYIYSAAAAVIVLLIVIGTSYFKPFGKPDNYEIFQSYYNTYPAIISYRSATYQNTTEKLVYDAFKNYNMRDFNKASVHFKMVLKVDNTNYLGKFYLSICEIEKDSLKMAEKYLNDLVLNKDHIFIEQSHWYLALVYIKQNKIDKAENILKKIIAEDMTQKSDAESILKKFN